MSKKAAPSTSPALASLKKAARDAASRSYSPYSHFRVGAAIVTDLGVFSGSNVENASYGLTNCAERTAIFAAAAAGARKLSCVVVYTPTPHPTAPCGACRQVIREFGPDARVISCCDGDGVIETTLPALLPGAFGPEDLGVDPADHGATGVGAAEIAGADTAGAAARKVSSKRAKKTS